MNQFVFNVRRPSDKLHKNFLSTWIHGENWWDAQEILSRTYKPENGFVLEVIYDLNKIKLAAELKKNQKISLDCASL